MRIIIVLLLVLVGVTAIFAYLLVPTWQIRLTGVHTQATVVAAIPRTSCHKSIPHTLRFVDTHGTPQEVDYCFYTDESIHTGDQLSLWYLPEQPDHILPESRVQSLIGTTLWWLLATCVLVVLSVYSLWRFVRLRERRRQAMTPWGQ